MAREPSPDPSPELGTDPVCPETPSDDAWLRDKRNSRPSDSDDAVNNPGISLLLGEY